MGSHPSLTVILLLVVVAVKFAGYVGAANVLARVYDRFDLNSYLVAGFRVLMGAVVDASCIALLWYVSRAGYEPGGMPFWLALFPFRLLEWWLLVWIFYDCRIMRPALGWKVAILGTLWSFAIDVALIVSLAVVGFILLGVTGGGIGK